jgi:transposase-like protein/CheY-like chemotaxis protein
MLIAEDERLIAQALGRRVTALGYTVVGLAVSGEEAVAQGDTLRPDVVPMGIGLRGAMDGLDARHIRAQAPIPVIYVSASTDAATVARAWQSAPAGHLVRPVSDRALRAALVRVLGDPPAPEDEVHDCFCLSYRDAEELLFARGVTVTCEAIRKWCRTFGPSYAKQRRHQQASPRDKWHLDEVFLTIRGRRPYLWSAVDQDGHVLDILGQPRRDKKATKKFFCKLLKGYQYIPSVITAAKLKSYEAAKRELLSDVEHRQQRYRDNRAENSHQPTRQTRCRVLHRGVPGHEHHGDLGLGPKVGRDQKSSKGRGLEA